MSANQTKIVLALVVAAGVVYYQHRDGKRLDNPHVWLIGGTAGAGTLALAAIWKALS